MTNHTEKPDNARLSLPVKISGITPQKKNKNRYSLFSEEQFICGVSADTLLKFNIQSGKELTPRLYTKIVHEEELQKIKSYLLNLLSRRDHSAGELKLKAAKKGFDRSLTGQIIDELQESNYVNDQKFADVYAREKSRLNKWGPQKIKSELYKKEIKSCYIEDAIKKLNESLDQRQICVDLVSKRKKTFLREKDLYKRKQKIFAYLNRKGFSTQTIISATKDLSRILDV
ncbi:MAG TPA: RecX family transcriptional regulator [Balneolaceae bacterium]|nr:RecX family transcriptional regulator [Balneolaceae bacterium]